MVWLSDYLSLKVVITLFTALVRAASFCPAPDMSSEIFSCQNASSASESVLSPKDKPANMEKMLKFDR